MDGAQVPDGLLPPFLPQPQASLTSAPHPLASMPTCRSTIFPTQRPFLRSATSRYVLPQEGVEECLS